MTILLDIVFASLAIALVASLALLIVVERERRRARHESDSARERLLATERTLATIREAGAQHTDLLLGAIERMANDILYLLDGTDTHDEAAAKWVDVRRHSVASVIAFVSTQKAIRAAAVTKGAPALAQLP